MPEDIRFQTLYRLSCRSASNSSIDTPSTPGAPLFALTFSQASFTAHFEISNGLPGDFNSSTRLLPNPNGSRLIERTQSQMTRPLRSTPITGASPLLRAGPPAGPATVLTPALRTGYSLSPTRKPERAVSDPAFSRSMQKPQTGLASPPCRTPPGQSAGTRQTHPGIIWTPRFRCHLCHVSTRQQRFACARLPDPHLTRHPRLFHIAHHGRVTAPAACGGLKPPPAGRLRRADNPSSPAQHRFTKLYLHRTPFHVRDTPR